MPRYKFQIPFKAMGTDTVEVDAPTLEAAFEECEKGEVVEREIEDCNVEYDLARIKVCGEVAMDECPRNRFPYPEGEH